LQAQLVANGEIIHHEYDGFLIQDDYLSPECKNLCIDLVLSLVNDDAYAQEIRSRAMAYSLNWHAIATEWRAHWDAVLRTGDRFTGTQHSPKVSVIMPVYNGEPFIGAAVDSILGQTLWDIELVVVNDGSTDQTGEILRGYSDPRVVVIDQSNQGTWAALNKGTRHARGQYIARMDADDISHPRRLQKQVECLVNNEDVGLVGTSGHILDAQRRIQAFYQVPVRDGDVKRQLPSGHPYLGASMMCRRSALDRVGLFPNCTAEDYEM